MSGFERGTTGPSKRGVWGLAQAGDDPEGRGQAIGLEDEGVGPVFLVDESAGSGPFEGAGKAVVEATQSHKSIITLFGGDMSISKPVFFRLPDRLVTVASVTVDGADKLMVQRMMPSGVRASKPLYIDFRVDELIAALGGSSKPDAEGKVRGLSLAYSQVLRVLNGMCDSGDIDARFILQRPHAIGKITSNADVGRADAPE